jgi:outer membrane protein assembly factor BamB
MVFLNVAEADGDTLSLWAVDRRTGQPVWKRPLSGGNNRQRKQNMSSPSPVTDGTTVWVMTGTGILKAFDFKGSERWARDIQKDYGRFGLNWGYANSPLLFEGDLIVPVLHGMKTDDPSYILRIDGKTGRTKWKVERPNNAIRESPDSYTTPALVRVGGAAEIVITGADVVTGHDPATGRELWRADGLNPQNDPAYRIVASPVVHEDLVIAPTRERPMLALKAGGRGDVTTSHKLWEFQNGPDVPTPVTDRNTELRQPVDPVVHRLDRGIV